MNIDQNFEERDIFGYIAVYGEHLKIEMLRLYK